ncbi:MAG: 3-hydroxyacyl-ACP dehydratase [Bacteroidetes bacterium]|nr:3-hydroxyacyl-ACP dehydratase [Bacteroidota bacterium]MBL6943279.1 3-hydroxyacyl-ACP dehydratase [Bacteroidales bacterium]
MIIADKNYVLELIPQKHPMVMVDGLINNDKTTTISKLSLSKDNIFCSNGYFQEIGLIENIAQTAALRAGYKVMENEEKPAIGFIGAIKNMIIYKLPNDDDKLQTKITIINQLMKVIIIKGEVMLDNRLIAECEMKIFLQ